MPTCTGGADARAHGIAAETHVIECLRRERAIERAEPCARTMLRFLHEHALDVVLTQPRVCSARLRVTAYVDFLCVDRRTRTKLTLIEMKAARGALNDECYAYEPPGEHSELGSHCSPRLRDLLQLWAMATTLRDECGIRLEAALLVRVQPTHYRVEALTPETFDERAAIAAFQHQ